MSGTPIADMVEGMFGDGATLAVVLRAIRAIEMSIPVRGQSTDKSDAKRIKDRDRKREERRIARENKGKAEANDAATSPPASIGLSTDSADKRCDSFLLSSSLFPEERSIQQESKKEKKKEVSTRAKGTRLTADWLPSEADRKFALDNSVDPDNLRLEFIDFWIGVPGQRGVKLDWSATWRNRVRQISGGKNGQRPRQSRSNSQDALLAGFRSALSERPDSRFYRGNEAGRREGPQGGADDPGEPVTIEAGPGDYSETH